MKGARLPGRPGFPQPDGVAQQRGRTDDGQQQEHVVEVQMLADETAHHRADHRPQRHHHLERTHRPAARGAFEAIADHRDRHHRSGGDADRLQRAERQQCLDAIGQETAQRSDDIDCQAGQQGALAPTAIHQRPVDDLHEGQHQREDRDAEVDQKRRGAQRTTELRQDRRIHGLSERPEKGGEADHEGQQAWAHQGSSGGGVAHPGSDGCPGGSAAYSLTCMYSSAQTTYSSAVEYLTDNCEALRSRAST